MPKRPKESTSQTEPRLFESVRVWLRRDRPTPHRSFRLSRRRDRVRPEPLPNYFRFTAGVFATVRQEWRLLLKVSALHLLLTIVLIGVMGQAEYRSISDAIREVATATFGESSQLTTGLLLLTSAAGGLGAGLSGVQQLYLLFLNIMTGLVVVWLLRQRLSGAKVTLREGLYKSPTPLIALFIIIIIGLLQLLPASLGLLIFSVAINNSVLTGGIEAAMFGIAALLLILLSLYWLSATIIAGVIVTLPGTYPVAALRAAYRVTAGRRLTVIIRLVWLLLLLVLLWLVLLLPVILLDNALQQSVVPLVPFMIRLLSTFSLVLGVSYLYLLYRKMIGDEA